MFNDFYPIFISFVIMFIWFKTEAFIEYGKLFKPFGNLFKIFDFIKFREKNPEINYHVFLLIQYNNFFTRLMTCPICINTWINISFIPFLANSANFFVNFTLSIILYFTGVILLKYHDRENI